MFDLLYNLLFIPFGSVALKALAPLNEKIRKRESAAPALIEELSLNPLKPGFTVLFHSASMGEFEQAKPVIEKIKTERPEVNVVCSFFSPSGYENQKNYSFADKTLYLPFDSKRAVNRFLDAVNPDAVVIVRYEIWRNLLRETRRRSIPLYLICATRPGSGAFDLPCVKAFTRSNYSMFDEIATIGETHTEYFRNLGVVAKLHTLHDARMDRIIAAVEKAFNSPILPREIFSEDEFVLVAGSSWEKDEDLIIDALKSPILASKKIRVVFVPHEPTPEHINKLSTKLGIARILKKN